MKTLSLSVSKKTAIIRLTFDFLKLSIVSNEVILNHHLTDHFASTGAQSYNRIDQTSQCN